MPTSHRYVTFLWPYPQIVNASKMPSKKSAATAPCFSEVVKDAEEFLLFFGNVTCQQIESRSVVQTQMVYSKFCPKSFYQMLIVHFVLFLTISVFYALITSKSQLFDDLIHSNITIGFVISNIIGHIYFSLFRLDNFCIIFALLCLIPLNEFIAHFNVQLCHIFDFGR